MNEQIPPLLKGEIEVIMPDGSSILAPSHMPPDVIKARWELAKLQDFDPQAEFRKRKADITQKYGEGAEAALRIPMNERTQEQREAAKELLTLGMQTRGGFQDMQARRRKAEAVLEKYEVDTKGNALDKAGFVAKNAAKSLLKGVASAVALPAELLGSGGFVEGTTNAIGGSPVTRGEQTLDTILQAAAGGVIGPGASAMKNLAFGAGVGGGIDVGQRATGDSPLGGLAGGLGLAGAMMIPTLLKIPQKKLAQELVQEIPEDQLLRAKQVQEEAAAEGLGSLNLSQAMDSTSGVDSLIDALANSRHGKNVQKQLNQQPIDASITASDALAMVPGEVTTPQIAANTVQKALTDVRKGLDKERSAVYKENLPEDTDIGQAAAKSMIEEIEALKTSPDAKLSPSEIELVDGIVGSLVKSSKEAAEELSPAKIFSSKNPLKAEAPAAKRGVEYLTDASDIDKELKFGISSFKANKFAMDPNAKKLDRVENMVKAIVDQYTAPVLGEAKAATRQFSEENISPFMQSVSGRNVGKGYAEDKEAVATKLMSLFDKGSNPNSSVSEILTLQKDMAKSPEGKQAYQEAFKTWLSTKIAKASEAEAGRVPTDLAAKLTSFFGDPNRRGFASQGMKDSFVALARSQDLPDDTYLKGLQHIQLFLSRASRRPGTVGDTDKAYINAMKSDVPLTAGGTKGQQAGIVARYFNEWRTADAYKFLDNVLTTPEGTELLIRLAKEPALSPRAEKAITTFLSLQAAQGE